MVFQTEKAIEEVGDKLEAGDKAAVEADIASLKTVLERTRDQSDISDADLDELKAGKEKLMESAQKLFAKMYEQTQGAQGAGPGPDMGAGAGAADDVVDGDYREV